MNREGRSFDNGALYKAHYQEKSSPLEAGGEDWEDRQFWLWPFSGWHAACDYVGGQVRPLSQLGTRLTAIES
jgi:hypothetical protein